MAVARRGVLFKLGSRPPKSRLQCPIRLVRGFRWSGHDHDHDHSGHQWGLDLHDCGHELRTVCTLCRGWCHRGYGQRGRWSRVNDRHNLAVHRRWRCGRAGRRWWFRRHKHRLLSGRRWRWCRLHDGGWSAFWRPWCDGFPGQLSWHRCKCLRVQPWRSPTSGPIAASDGPAPSFPNYGSGGGGGYSANAQNGGNGGHGSIPGGGGGGGGGCRSPFTSGAGGNGARGEIRIWEFA